MQLETEHKQQRRKLLKKERDVEYRNCIAEFFEKKKMINTTVKSRVLEAFEISHQEYDSTYKKYYEQPQYAKVLSNLDQIIKNKRIQTSNTKPITKTQAIQSMQRVEA